MGPQTGLMTNWPAVQGLLLFSSAGPRRKQACYTLGRDLLGSWAEWPGAGTGRVTTGLANQTGRIWIRTENEFYPIWFTQKKG
ncbi:hypothetical protein V6N13_110388 [Hibiscus sabdariffa]